MGKEMFKSFITRFRIAMYMVAALLMFTALAAAHGKMYFSAKLSGAQETPPVTAKATGAAYFHVNMKTGEITYMVHVKDIEDVTMAHIHMGAKGKSGPPIAMLNVKTRKGKFSGMLAKGKITKSDLMGPFQGKTVKDLVDEIKTGGTYVNVHTKTNPDGEIRGQIEPRK